MRASPVALVDDEGARNALLRRDCYLTNPSSTAVEAVAVYVRILRHCLTLPSPVGGDVVRRKLEEELAQLQQDVYLQQVYSTVTDQQQAHPSPSDLVEPALTKSISLEQ